MTFDYQNSKLWQRTLASREDDTNQAARDQLRQAFIKTREKVKPLVNLIGQELPSLTVHDISHLDALWGVADVVLGDDYPINPAEAFVLDMAFLLHDAATTTFAYQSGVDELKATTEWRDYAAQKGYDDEQLKKGEPAYQDTLFEVLRILHPQQAESLLTNTWVGMDGKSHMLCDDPNLTQYYGSNIGKIAHSHWWNAAEIEQKLGGVEKMTLPAFLHVQNEDWRVDLLKIAFILRCVDAAHIDSRRAPTMLAALMQPKGYSGLHWYFQNQLGCAAVSDKGLIYWSAGQPFDKTHADAWWLYFDTAKMIDRELKTAQRILSDYNRPVFAAQGVLGANDLAEFKKYAPVQGWEPVDVNFQVSNVPNIVEKFGGAALYGDNPWLALRELIQNAADATRAARALGILEADEGRIDIELEERGDEKWLHVTDQGIGMSKYVLTDVLLDFGRSLWSDTAVRREWAGLSASGFKSVGQFGIGFFSVFMLGDEVEVTTWHANKAKDEQLKLTLRNKALARPIVSPVLDNERLKKHGTKVSIKLNNKSSHLPRLPKHPFGFDEILDNKRMSLAELVGHYAPTLDIGINCKQNSCLTSVLKANDWKNISGLELACRVSPSLKYAKQKKKLTLINEAISRLFDLDDRLIGRLVITGGVSDDEYSFYNSQLGAYVNQGILVELSNDFIGVFNSNNNTDLSRKLADVVFENCKIAEWINEQSNVLYNHKKIDVGWMNTALPRGLELKNEHPIAIVGQEIFNLKKFEVWIDTCQYDEIICIAGEPDFYDYCEQHDDFDVTRNNFYEEFVLHPNVVCIGISMLGDGMFSLVQPNAIDCLGVVENILSTKWKKIERCGYIDYPVGELFGNEVMTGATVFSKC